MLIFPAVVPKVTVIVVVPCPEVMVAPAGIDQIYLIALETEFIEYIIPDEERQTEAGPVIVPGLIGNGLTKIVAVAVLVHLFASVPVTVYVVEVIGFTLLVEPIPKPLLHI